MKEHQKDVFTKRNCKQLFQNKLKDIKKLTCQEKKTHTQSRIRKTQKRGDRIQK